MKIFKHKKQGHITGLIQSDVEMVIFYPEYESAFKVNKGERLVMSGSTICRPSEFFDNKYDEVTEFKTEQEKLSSPCVDCEKGDQDDCESVTCDHYVEFFRSRPGTTQERLFKLFDLLARTVKNDESIADISPQYIKQLISVIDGM